MELWQMARFRRMTGRPAEFEPGTKRRVEQPEPRDRRTGRFKGQPKPFDRRPPQ